MWVYYIGLAWRRCRRAPGMVLLVVLTMAVGLASCMTAATVFAALSGAPLPGISDHLYVVSMDARPSTKDQPSQDGPPSYLSLYDAQALQAATPGVAQVAIATSLGTLSSAEVSGHGQVALGLMVEGDVFTTFGVPLAYGRPWSAAEQTAHTPVVVIDGDFARKLFGAEDAVGRSVMLNKHRFRVIGVTAAWKPRIQFYDLPRYSGHATGQETDFFVPVQAALDAGLGPMTSGDCGGATDISFGAVDVQHCRWLERWMALSSSAQRAEALRRLQAYASAQHAAGRFAEPPHAALYRADRWMDMHGVVPSDVPLNLALAAAFLLLCMINVAGLLAARFLRRQADVAVRRALGASVRTVFLQHVIETGLLGLAGGLLGLPLTALGLWVVRLQPVVYAPAAQLHPGVFAGLALLSALVGVLVGVLPAWRVCRQPLALQIKQA